MNNKQFKFEPIQCHFLIDNCDTALIFRSEQVQCDSWNYLPTNNKVNNVDSDLMICLFTALMILWQKKYFQHIQWIFTSHFTDLFPLIESNLFSLITRWKIFRVRFLCWLKRHWKVFSVTIRDRDSKPLAKMWIQRHTRSKWFFFSLRFNEQ